MPGIQRFHTVGVMAVTLGVAIGAAFLPRLTKVEDLYDIDSYRSWGPWYMVLENYDVTGAGVKLSTAGSYQCDDWYPMAGTPATECSDAQLAKCRATQALAILGPSFNLVAMVVTAARCGPAMLSPIMIFVSGSCYLVVWALTADLHHNDTDTADSDCGYGGPEFQRGKVKYGACFAMYVSAWLLAWCGAGMALLQRVNDLSVLPE